MASVENFELTKEYLATLRDYIEKNNEQQALDMIKGLHPADIAQIYDEITIEEAKFLYLLLDGEIAADVLSELEEDDRERFLKVLPNEVIAKQFLEHMDSDDAADLIGDLDEERKDEVLSMIDDVGQAGDIVDLLNYDPDTAGGMMAKELIAVNQNLNAKLCITEIKRQTEEVDEIYYVYVIDDDNKLLGTLPLKKLLVSPDEEKVINVCDKDIISVSTDAPSEEVANLMEKYNLVAVPVIDSIDRLVGRITIDDVVDVIRDEADDDYQKATGLSADVEPTDSVWQLTRARIPWLVIGLFGGILGAEVIGLFEGELEKYKGLALFIPLIAAMGGNAGVQSAAIVVQALASNRLGTGGIFSNIFKEFLVATVNALLIGTIIFLYNFFFSDSFALTISVSGALVIVIMIASVMGTAIPLILNRFKIDPAMATGPFITTINDIFGLFVYFVVGKMVFEMMLQG